MTRRRIFLGATLIAALAIIAVLWGIQLEANRHLREQADASRLLLSRLEGLEVDNLRLSNIVVRANTPLAEDQLAELAKLRGEVQQLRHRTNDLQTMKSEIRRLRTELANARSVIASNAPPDVPAEDIFPRDSWAFAGYDTPEAALETVNWAIGQGDEESYLASLAPDLQDAMESQLADGSFADTAPLEMGNATGFRILERETVSDNERIITVYMDGDGHQIPLRFVKTADGWKVAEEVIGQP
jgi:hypothetical protein